MPLGPLKWPWPWRYRLYSGPRPQPTWPSYWLSKPWVRSPLVCVAAAHARCRPSPCTLAPFSQSQGPRGTSQSRSRRCPCRPLCQGSCGLHAVAFPLYLLLHPPPPHAFFSQLQGQLAGIAAALNKAKGLHVPKVGVASDDSKRKSGRLSPSPRHSLTPRPSPQLSLLTAQLPKITDPQAKVPSHPHDPQTISLRHVLPRPPCTPCTSIVRRKRRVKSLT